MVKSVLSDIQDEKRRKGKTTNCTTLMGHLIGCLNSHELRGAQDKSSYETVYGVPYHENLLCHIDEMRRCTTLEQRPKIRGYFGGRISRLRRPCHKTGHRNQCYIGGRLPSGRVQKIIQWEPTARRKAIPTNVKWALDESTTGDGDPRAAALLKKKEGRKAGAVEVKFKSDASEKKSADQQTSDSEEVYKFDGVTSENEKENFPTTKEAPFRPSWSEEIPNIKTVLGRGGSLTEAETNAATRKDTGGGVEIKEETKDKTTRPRVGSVTGEALSHVTEGTLVALKMDPRDAKKARGLLEIVYDTSGNRGGEIKVATQHGIITKENKKNEYFVPSDRYAVPKIQDVALTPSLERVRKEIMDGVFDRKSPMPKAYKLVEGVDAVKKGAAAAMARSIPISAGASRQRRSARQNASLKESVATAVKPLLH
ncbi:hypothetical protein IV203_028940 [Nitzschia inconspicua]|uniref:Uncharacterized protein n=1 Tax=Nitzschia inconspicua TaxID=303405 RepID=A0A9K3LQK9_9STRA|nr:hypothetical protein IV203_028940 [Nitzschia inconspicua]